MRNTLLAVTLSSSCLTAQTFIVDASNGPGTTFTSLPTAAAAVPDGAVLLVRAGTYDGFAVAQKGLVVLGEPGVTVTGHILFDDLAASQPIVLRDLHFQVSAPGLGPLIWLTQCLGPILLEGITNTRGCDQTANCNPPLQAWKCPQLVARDCTLLGPVQLGTGIGREPSAATFENCSLTGHPVPQSSSATPAIRIGGSTVQIVSSVVTGGDGGSNPLFGPANASGIHASWFADLRVLDSTIAGGTAATFGGWGIEVSGQATLRLDPSSVVNGVNGPTTGVTPQISAMPHLRATSASPGGTITATTTTEIGDLVILAIGLRGAPVTLPGFIDAFWLDPAVHVFHTIGTQQPGMPVNGSVPVPNAAGFVGLQLLWHAACYGPVTGLQNSNPAVSLIR